MNTLKAKPIISLCLILIMVSANIATVSGLTYFGNHHYTKPKLENSSHFTPSRKTPSSSSYKLRTNAYVKGAWVKIVEGSDTSYKNSKDYSKSTSGTKTVSCSQLNNPLKSQKFTHGWRYN